uniref:Uncharacterized protein n=1 Tax=Palpitomonas bilix TaxID=652834 RepID=A0A7S3DE14_9EUKA|mmetsp:Transcript_3335/g.6523  ORF Transcript_3335/g.6523 Transcript_3335/m.6523 type:complete len:408 (+) Transcript_3335:3-1226(+)
MLLKLVDWMATTVEDGTKLGDKERLWTQICAEFDAFVAGELSKLTHAKVGAAWLLSKFYASRNDPQSIIELVELCRDMASKKDMEIEARERWLATAKSNAERNISEDAGIPGLRKWRQEIEEEYLVVRVQKALYTSIEDYAKETRTKLEGILFDLKAMRYNMKGLSDYLWSEMQTRVASPTEKDGAVLRLINYMFQLDLLSIQLGMPGKDDLLQLWQNMLSEKIEYLKLLESEKLQEEERNGKAVDDRRKEEATRTCFIKMVQFFAAKVAEHHSKGGGKTIEHVFGTLLDSIENWGTPYLRDRFVVDELMSQTTPPYDLIFNKYNELAINSRNENVAFSNRMCESLVRAADEWLSKVQASSAYTASDRYTANKLYAFLSQYNEVGGELEDKISKTKVELGKKFRFNQ